MSTGRCREPFRVPTMFVELAVALAARVANAGSVALAVQCERGPHDGGEHAVHVLYVDDESGRAAWVFWDAEEVRVQLKDPCPEVNAASDVCLLFAEHSGGHLWPGGPMPEPYSDGRAGRQDAGTGPAGEAR
ncbi:hypothetical protein ACH4SP_04745 [Streptomyces sp. NPDC021093]|uniref:hypothetical protein n=1 Tax=Streptomyces sp. NPDC021093 TaxID=3365112 RepID=UPI0037B4306F